MGSVENGVPSKKPLPTKDVNPNGSTGRQRGAGQDSFRPATSNYNYRYPGSSGGSRDKRSSRVDNSRLCPPYGLSPGLLKFYGPAEIIPTSRHQKQGQFQNGGCVPFHSSNDRICNASSRIESRDKSTRKGDYGGSEEITSGPRGKMLNGSSSTESRDKLARKGGYEGSEKIASNPRVNKRNDYVDSAYVPSGVSGLGDKYNVSEFQVEYERANFFVIKSFTEDDVQKCIKYDVWSSTQNGNKKLDGAFHDVEVKFGEFGKCPIFLFFSVNGSGQFVGLSEMVGKVDYNKTMDFWKGDQWCGFFPVKWHIIKDIPNRLLRHILLENNENRPVTYTRDTQEIGLKEGLKMLKIFKDYPAKSSLLDDFEFYEDRGKALESIKSGNSYNSADKRLHEGLMENYPKGKRAVTTNNVSNSTSLLSADLTKKLSINSSEDKVRR